MSTPANQPPPSQTRATPPQELNGADIQFLLADFTNLREFSHNAQAGNDRRTDLLLTFTAALAAGLALLHQAPIERRDFLFICLVSAISLALVALAWFQLILRKDMGALDYIRGMNQIRKYFAEQAPHLQPYLMMPVSHRFPKYGSLSAGGHSRIIALIISLLVGASAAVSVVLWRQKITLDFFSLMLGCLFFATTFFSLERYATWYYHRADKKTEALRDEHALFASHEQVFNDVISKDWIGSLVALFRKVISKNDRDEPKKLEKTEGVEEALNSPG